MERLGMTELIGSKPCRERDLVLAMVAQRVLRPDSKLGTAARFADTTLATDFGVQEANEDDLYAAMDWVLDRQPFIEKKLAQRHLKTGGRVFYDLSSSSYYGSHCPLAARCHNRDGLKLPAIAYGLLTDDGGRPVALSVYPGNTGDPTTVPDQVEALRQRFGIGRLCWWATAACSPRRRSRNCARWRAAAGSPVCAAATSASCWNPVGKPMRPSSIRKTSPNFRTRIFQANG